MKAKPYGEAERTAEAQALAARFKAAQEAAAKGGWPADAVCSISGLSKPRITLWAWTVATFFGAGLGKPGPGTWGSVAATLIWSGAAWLNYPRHTYFIAPSQLGLFILTLAGIALSIALGVPAATIAAREAGREDPGFVVIDEVAGVWITLLPLCFAHQDWKHILLALLLFRVFDIWKPYPIRKLENLPEGWGIVFDDVAAGLYAGAVLLVVMHWF